MRSTSSPLTFIAFGLLFLASGASGCSACRTTPANEAATSTPAPEAYTPPAEGATSLIESMRGRRDAGSGQITIEGRLLLPAGTRVWVDLYRSGIASVTDPLARAELYLGPRGAFEAGPFKVPADSKFRVAITSYFTGSWQPSEVITLVGLGGARLPKSALRLDRPNAPGMGAHLEESADVNIGS